MSDPGYLLDTNVISEVARGKPDERVAAFMRTIRDEHSFLSVLTIGELRRGAEMRRVVDRRHAEKLDLWIDSVEESFTTRILPVDLPTARLWGELSAKRPRAAVDTLIAATAIVHNLTLVTRNTRDVADTGVALVNPWR
ncbi:MAG: type II toxin-antitoxin system VapC family toxin [Bauldia sp.]